MKNILLITLLISNVGGAYGSSDDAFDTVLDDRVTCDASFQEDDVLRDGEIIVFSELQSVETKQDCRVEMAWKNLPHRCYDTCKRVAIV